MFKRTILILLIMLSIGIYFQPQPQVAQAQDLECLPSFEVILEDGTEYQGNAIWFLDPDGIPYVARLLEGMFVVTGYESGLTFLTPELTFLSPDGVQVRSFGEFHDVQMLDWNGSVVTVLQILPCVQLQDPCWVTGDYRVTYPDGTVQHTSNLEYQLWSNPYAATIAKAYFGYEFHITHYGNSYASPEIEFDDQSGGGVNLARMYLAGVFRLAPYGNWYQSYDTNSLAVIDWQGNDVTVSPLVGCPVPWMRPGR